MGSTENTGDADGSDDASGEEAASGDDFADTNVEETENIGFVQTGDASTSYMH